MERIEVANSVFEGRNNVYLLGAGSDGRLTLVDTAIRQPGILAEVEEAIEAAGRSIGEVDDIFLTHYHEDHVGLAGDLQAESGATVYAPAGDAALVAGDELAWDDYRQSHDRKFESWGVPPDKQDELREAMFTLQMDLDDRPSVERVEDGDRFDLGHTKLQAVHLPGHSVGHSGYQFESDDRLELFSGDALLPQYTPNVGGADIRVEDSLATYLQTLDQIIDAGYDRALPGHRPPIEDPTARAHEIKDHHLDRTRNVLSVLDEERPKRPWEISGELFGELSGIHVLHGPGEAEAHAEHLVFHGVVEHVEGGYRITQPDVDVASLF